MERAPAFRTGGQNIDIRGAAREVIRRAGLEDTVRSATTGEVGTRFIGEDGKDGCRVPGHDIGHGGRDSRTGDPPR